MSRRLKKPLNEEAVKKATKEFYANHHELNGKPLSATDPKQAALRKEWMDLYVKHVGEVENKTSRITEQDYNDVAKDLGVDVCAIKAIATVESRGDGFLSSDHPKVLFESHKFHKYSRGKYDKSHPELSHTYWEYDEEGNVMRDKKRNKIRHKTYYKGGEQEVTARLNKAIILDSDAALKSASWGKFQIMGFNYKEAGFNSVQEFVAAMKKNEGEHLKAFGNLIKNNPSMHNALKNKNWAKFAKQYNGSDYSKKEYDKKMATAYQKCRSSQEATNNPKSKKKLGETVTSCSLADGIVPMAPMSVSIKGAVGKNGKNFVEASVGCVPRT